MTIKNVMYHTNADPTHPAKKVFVVGIKYKNENCKDRFYIEYKTRDGWTGIDHCTAFSAKPITTYKFI